MGIVVALDVHRKQITFKTLDRGTGELRRGRIAPATRAEVRAWLSQFADCQAEFAVEGTTGWRFAVEEIERAGQHAHLADPAETAARRGRKRRAKTDNADCDLQLRLLLAGELPESWIPPAQILELRTLVRLRKTLIDQRTAWQQRIHAQLFHQGVPGGLRLRTEAGREALQRAELSPAGRELVALGMRMLDAFDLELAPLDRELRAFARSQPGCRALIEQLYGVGPVSATAILAELGDCRRFSSSDDAVRHAGLDITVYQSDEKRAPGHLSHEGAGGLALGALRGGRLGRPHRLARPRLLPPGRRTARPQPRLPLGRAQTLPTCLPPPPRARRAGTRPDRAASGASGDDRSCCLTTPPPVRACPSSRRCSAAGSPQTPSRHATSLDGLERPSGRKQPPAGTTPDRSSCRRTIHVRAPR
jgi:transposase